MIVAIIQARANSKRIPRKMLLDVNGRPLLARTIERVRRAHLVDDVVVATSDKDQQIVELAKNEGVVWFAGSEDDVLDRVYQAALKVKADAVVRITGDCPLIDPEIIDLCVDRFKFYYPDIDYVSNLLPRTYPRGLDTEVVSVETLKSEWETAQKWREHVTLNIREDYQNYRTSNINSVEDRSYMRWCVDNAEDLKFVRSIYEYFSDRVFGWRDVVNFLENNPALILKDTQLDPN